MMMMMMDGEPHVEILISPRSLIPELTGIFINQESGKGERGGFLKEVLGRRAAAVYGSLKARRHFPPSLVPANRRARSSLGSCRSVLLGCGSARISSPMVGIMPLLSTAATVASRLLLRA